MAVTLADLIINVSVSDDDIKSQLNRVEATVNRSMRQAGRKSGGILATSIGTALGVGLANAASGIVSRVTSALSQIPGEITNMAVSAAKVEGVRDALNSMAADMGTSSQEIVSALKEATDGTVSEATLMQNAIQALSLIGKGTFTDFTSEFADASDLVRRAARATGQDIGFLMQSLVLGVGRNSKVILDNLGIMVSVSDAQDRYAASLGKTADELTDAEKKAATWNAALDALRANYGNVNASSGGLNQTMQQLRATVADFRQELGTQFSPIINKIGQGFLQLAQTVGPRIIDTVRSMLTNWLNGISSMERETARGLGRLAGLVYSFGINIARALAEGITAAVSFVVQALGFIGNAITNLLQPGSPPKLLPDLTDWGKETANEWLKGWTLADFGIIRDAGDAVKNILTNMRGDLVSGLQSRAGRIREGESKASILESVIGTRQAVADAIQQFKTTGNVAVDAFERIRDAAGAAGEAVIGLVRRQLDLAKATEKVRGIQSKLSEVEEKLADIRDRQRLASIEAQLAAGGLSAEERQALLLESQRTQLEGRLRDAQREEQIRQNELDIFKERLGLQQEALGLTQGIADALSHAAEAGKQLKNSITEALGEIPSLMPTTADLGGIFDEQFTKITDLIHGEIIPGFLEGEEAMNGFLRRLGFDIPEKAEATAMTLAESNQAIVDSFANFGAEVDKAVGPMSRMDQIISQTKSTIEKFLPGQQTLEEFTGRLAETWRKWFDAGLEVLKLLGDLALLFTDVLLAPVEIGLNLFMQLVEVAFPGLVQKAGEALPSLETIGGVFDAIGTGAGNARDAIDGFRQKIEGIVEKASGWTDALNKLPIIGRSPSPMEEGLTGINKSIQQLTSSGARKLLAFAKIVGSQGRTSLAKSWGRFASSITDTEDATDSFETLISRQVMRTLEDLDDLVGIDLIDSFEELIDLISNTFIPLLDRLERTTREAVVNINSELRGLDFSPARDLEGLLNDVRGALQGIINLLPDLQEIRGVLEDIVEFDIGTIDINTTLGPLVDEIASRISALHQTNLISPFLSQMHFWLQQIMFALGLNPGGGGFQSYGVPARTPFLPPVTPTIDLPPGIAAAAGAGSGTGTIVNNINLGPINNELDLELAARRILRIIEDRQ